MKVLAMDIGGTNTRVGLYDVGKKPMCIRKKKHPTKNIKQFEDVIRNFLKDEQIDSVCIGFAGPIIGDKAKLTNAKLSIDANRLKKEFGFKKVKLVNDFIVTSKGIPFLKTKEIHTLNKSKFENNVEMVVGPGTGLGKAYIIDGKPYPSEGGQTTLGIENIEEYALLDYLKKRGKNPVYYEDVVSGRGIIDIYDHLEIKSNIDFDMDVRKKIRTIHVRTAEIITKTSEKDQLCRITLLWFVRFYARYVRTSALHLLPSEIYLGGGVSPAIKDSLEKHFMPEFTKHRSYSDLLSKMGVHIILNTDIGLVGAAALAAED